MVSRIGDLLLKAKLITEEQLEEVTTSQKASGASFNITAAKLNFIDEDALLDFLRSTFRLDTAELTADIEKSTFELLPSNIAHKHQILPIGLKDQTLIVAMADPTNIAAINDIKFITGYDILIKLAKESDIRVALDIAYDDSVSYDNIISDLDETEVEVVDETEDVNLKELERATEDAPVVKLVNAVLVDAIKKNASDIHIEPYEKTFRVRFRIDGVLYEIMKPPMKLKNAITSRIKIMADLDIAERRLPQDGRIKLKLGNKKEMDYRVNVLPTLFGEKVVLRLLDKSNLQLDMTKLGFEEKQLKDFKESIYKPYGLVLVTGPTGSGKTTTLYSALSELNRVGTNISTAEDPVEFNLAGINQAQMHNDIGFNFASALRAFLRQDPDIIMVGEIRDYETAEIAIKAALTGHLVLSTLHTNDATSTVNRLLNMGVEPFLVSSAINLILAQRLARRVCSGCVAPHEVDPEVLVNIGIPATEARSLKLMKGKGCQKCAGTGYKGRIALYEVMPMSEELREYVLSGASTVELKREAVRIGMMTLRASALMRLKEGTTTVEEVLRVTAAD